MTARSEVSGELQRFLADEAATRALGAELARALRQHPCVVYLHGNLGAGKTTLVRGFLQGLGHTGPVRSPTYTLIEGYEPGAGKVYHLDLYRLADAEELEFLGIRDLLDASSTLLIEWPEKGVGFLPPPDLELFLDYQEKGRDTGRRARLQALSARGQAALAALLAPDERIT